MLKGSSQTFQWYMYNTATMSSTTPTHLFGDGVPARCRKEQGGHEYYQSGSLGQRCRRPPFAANRRQHHLGALVLLREWGMAVQRL